MDPNQVGSTNNRNQSKPKQAKEAVSQVAHQAKEEIAKGARQAKEQLSHQAEDQVEAQKNRAAGRINNVTVAIDRLAEELRENDETWLSEQAMALASGVRRASDSLRRKQTREIVDDVRSWSRNPVAFLGGAFAIGLAAGRFLKSSARSTSTDHAYSGDYSGPSYNDREELLANQRWGEPNDVYATPPSPAIPGSAPLGGATTSTSRTVSVGNGSSVSGRNQ